MTPEFGNAGSKSAYYMAKKVVLIVDIIYKVGKMFMHMFDFKYVSPVE